MDEDSSCAGWFTDCDEGEVEDGSGEGVGCEEGVEVDDDDRECDEEDD